MSYSVINVRMEEELKNSFNELVEQLGLSISAAFTLFAKTAVREQRIPFSLELRPNLPQTPTVIDENRSEMVAEKSVCSGERQHAQQESRDRNALRFQERTERPVLRDEIKEPQVSELPHSMTGSNLAVGNIVTFGRYYDIVNGRDCKKPTLEQPQSPIAWRVLANEGGRALLISECGLDVKPYNEKQTRVTWEKSTLRQWLNSEFLNMAFTDEERALIIQVRNKNTNNAKYRASGGNDTYDSVFLLNIDEAELYFKNNKERKCIPANYAKARKAFSDKKTGRGLWWLRSPGLNSKHAAYVHYGGVLCDLGDDVDNVRICVRPALWVQSLQS